MGRRAARDGGRKPGRAAHDLRVPRLTSPPGQLTDETAEFEHRYGTYLATRHGTLRIFGLDLTDRKRATWPLDAAYYSLEAAPTGRSGTIEEAVAAGVLAGFLPGAGDAALGLRRPPSGPLAGRAGARRARPGAAARGRRVGQDHARPVARGHHGTVARLFPSLSQLSLLPTGAMSVDLAPLAGLTRLTKVALPSSVAVLNADRIPHVTVTVLDEETGSAPDL